MGCLAAWGHENHLAGFPEGPLLRAAREKGIKTFPLRVRSHVDFRPAFFLRRLTAGEKYDIVHFHTSRAHALSFFMGGAARAAKYVVTRRMDYAVGRDWYHRRLYNRCVDGVVAISQTIADILEACGVERGRIQVIYSGVEISRFVSSSALDPARDPVVIGVVAALEERKGHRFLLEAAAALKRDGLAARYRFAGAGKEEGSLRRLAAELGLAEEVAFLGFVADIPAFLAGVDIFVLPSLYEGLGVAALEAMAARKPVVAAGVGGLRELVEEGVTGLLVPPRDPRSLTRALASLISSGGLRVEMGQRGRRRVEEDFTMERMAKRNEDYYYELIGRRSGAEVRGIGAKLG
jgi:glycosyltransferase involved in cell wall biosynthesis